MTVEDLLARFEPGWPAILDIGEGWFQLVVDLDRAIALLDPDYTVHQVKEKFGSLRYYVNITDPSVFEAAHALIRIAETASATTCEVCGEYGVLRTHRPWQRTLCDVHADPVQSAHPEV